nr:2Fe-2S iron-sulfur cluster-binding protein [Dongshaea marina]
MKRISLEVNGQELSVSCRDEDRLLDLLREELGLTGTKEGCSVGECGACTVILNGDAVCACLVLAVQCDGARIQTIEGVCGSEKGKALQQAFVEKGGVQCGFCTPGS